MVTDSTEEDEEKRYPFGEQDDSVTQTELHSTMGEYLSSQGLSSGLEVFLLHSQ